MRIFLTALAVSALAFPALAASDDGEAVETDVRAWLQAFVDRDGATLDRLTAAEFVQVQDGEKMERAMALGMPLHSPDYRVEAMQVDRVDVAVSGDTARVSAQIVRRDNFSGRVYNTRTKVAQIWKRKGADWQIVRDEEAELK
jgi:ketosteroid isomerase-like protein